MEMTNNQFGRLELTVEALHRASYLYENEPPDDSTEAKINDILFDILYLWKQQELNILIGEFKGIWNRGKPVKINTTD